MTVPADVGGLIVLDAPARPNEPILRWRSRAHSIEEVELELARIWSQANLAGASDADGDLVNDRHIGARTSVMNLVVVARRPEIGEHAAAIIQQLIGKHPSRTLILTSADPESRSWLDAHIQAYCVLPRADAAETCAEQIFITAGGAAGRHLEAIVAPLLIHDLPVTLWWPGEPPFATQPASDLLAMADRLVIDGSTWSGDGLERLRHLSAAMDRYNLDVSDFALVRQSRWREAIASAFDLPEFTPFLTAIKRISVTYGTRDDTGAPGTTNVVKPVYHVAWLASRLGMTVVKPLVSAGNPSTVRGGSRQVTRPGGKPPLHRGLIGELRSGRSDVAVVVRPIGSTMPAGTTLRVEILAEKRGSELRADVTAEAETVHVRVWLDGVEALDRAFLAARRTEVDLLAEAVEAGTVDKISRDAIRMAAKLTGG